VEISLILSLIGIVTGLGFGDDKAGLLMWVLLGLLLINGYLLVYIVKSKDHLRRLNNMADNLTLEVINRFRFRKPINDCLSFQVINEVVKVKKFDFEIENELKGVCTGKDGADSILFEIYADSNVSFAELDFKYVDLMNGTHPAIEGRLVEEDRKLFLIRARFAKALRFDDEFHVKYSCKLKNAANFGDDYYSTAIRKNEKIVKEYNFTLEFYDEKPVDVEVFDATSGGKSKYLMMLEPDGEKSPFGYHHKMTQIRGSKDLVYKFKRKITEHTK
jgi:hypothetical protein